MKREDIVSHTLRKNKLSFLILIPLLIMVSACSEKSNITEKEDSDATNKKDG